MKCSKGLKCKRVHYNKCGPPLTYLLFARFFARLLAAAEYLLDCRCGLVFGVQPHRPNVTVARVSLSLARAGKPGGYESETPRLRRCRNRRCETASPGTGRLGRPPSESRSSPGQEPQFVVPVSGMPDSDNRPCCDQGQSRTLNWHFH